MRLRSWCFTSYLLAEPRHDKCSYIIYQEEICPTTEKKHWQGYVEFNNGVSMKTCQEHIGNPVAHCEPRKGTQKQAIVYCQKKDSSTGVGPFEYGTKKHMGARSDLDTMVEAIEDGATKREMLLEFRGNALRHLGMIDRAQLAFMGLDSVDRLIIEKREIVICTEVSGNTGPTPVEESDDSNEFSADRNVQEEAEFLKNGDPDMPFAEKWRALKLQYKLS